MECKKTYRSVPNYQEVLHQSLQVKFGDKLWSCISSTSSSENSSFSSGSSSSSFPVQVYSGVRMIRKDVHICPEHFGLPERYVMNVGRYSVRPGVLWERVRRLSPSINFCPRYIYILKLQIVICVLNCRSLIYACPFRLRDWMGRKYLPIKYLGRSCLPIKYLENNSVN